MLTFEEGVDSSKCSEALASIISMCNPHAILLSKITQRHIKQLTKGVFHVGLLSIQRVTARVTL
jgi:hypothetical protein